MITGRPRLISVGALVVLASMVTNAQSPGMNEQVRAQIEAAKTRLALTDAQRAKVEPIIRTGIERRMAIFKKYGLVDDSGRRTASNPPPQQLQGIRGELESAQADIVKQLNPILTPKQMEEYRKIQTEVRDGLRERAEGRGRARGRNK